MSSREIHLQRPPGSLILAIVVLCCATDARLAETDPESVITGSVLAGDGLPLPGASAALLRHPTQYDTLRQRLLGTLLRSSGSKSTTDAEGRFRLVATGTGVYTLEISMPGFVSVRNQPLAITESVELPSVKLVADIGLRTEISRVDGQPARHLVVEGSSTTSDFWRATGAGDGWRPSLRQARSDKNGIVNLSRAAGETLELRLFLPSESRALTRRASTNFHWVLRPPTAPLRSLRIVDSDGEGWPEVVVTAGQQGWPVGITDPRGQGSIRSEDALPIRLSTRDGRVQDAEVDPELVNNVFEIEKESRIHGRVVNFEGSAVAGALAWHNLDPGAFTITDEEGRFSLIGRSREDQILLQVEAPGYLPYTLWTHGSAYLDLELEQAAALVGRTLDTSGHPVAGVEIAAYELVNRKKPKLRLDRAADRARSDSEGHFRLGRLDPEGGYCLRARRAGFMAAEYVVGRLSPATVRKGVEVALHSSRSVSGRVVTPGQAPITGAEIRWIPAGEKRRRAPTLTSLSDENGRFGIPEIVTPKFDLAIRKDGFAPLLLRAVAIPEGGGKVPSEAHDLGTLILEPGASVEGIVTDPGDLPIEGAALWILDRLDRSAWEFVAALDGTPSDFETDPNGRFEIRDLAHGKRFHLVIRHPEFLPSTVEGVDVPTPAPLRIVLQPGRRIRGQVALRNGEPIASADITLSPSGSLIGATEIPLFGAEYRRIAVSRKDGVFDLTGVAAGRFEISASAEGYLPSEPIALETTTDTISGLLLVLERGTTLEGHVTTDDREPVAGARIASFPASGFSDAEGYYRIAGVAPGPSTVEIHHPAHRTVTLEVELTDGVHLLDVTMHRGEPLSGRVTTLRGTPLSDATVILDAAEPRERRRLHGFTDVGGEFRFEEVAAGNYTLEAHKRGYAPERETLHVGGELTEELEIVLSPEVTIEGRVVGLDPKELSSLRIAARHQNRRPRRAEIDFRGHYVIRGLAAGDWQIRAATRDQRRQLQMNVVLLADQFRVERDLEFGLGHTLSGHVFWSGEPLQGARISLRGRQSAVEPQSISTYDGRFEVSDLAAGSYRIGIAHPRHHLIHHQDVVLDGDLEVQVDIATSVVSGEVVSASDEAPVQEAIIMLEQLFAGDDGSLYASPTNSEGFFGFPRVTAGSYRISARKQGYAAHERRIEVLGSVEPLQLRLEPTPGLEVWPQYAGRGTPSSLSIAVLTPTGTLFSESRPVEDGRATFSTVPAGAWRVLMHAPGSAVVDFIVDIPGDPIPIVLPPASRLRLRVSPLLETHRLATATLVDGATQRLRGLDGFGKPTESWPVAGGLGSIEGVPAGIWTIEVTTADGDYWTRILTTRGEPEIQVIVP